MFVHCYKNYISLTFILISAVSYWCFFQNFRVYFWNMKLVHVLCTMESQLNILWWLGYHKWRNKKIGSTCNTILSSGTVRDLFSCNVLDLRNTCLIISNYQDVVAQTITHYHAVSQHILPTVLSKYYSNVFVNTWTHNSGKNIRLSCLTNFAFILFNIDMYLSQIPS